MGMLRVPCPVEELGIDAGGVVGLGCRVEELGIDAGGVVGLGCRVEELGIDAGGCVEELLRGAGLGASASSGLGIDAGGLSGLSGLSGLGASVSSGLVGFGLCGGVGTTTMSSSELGVRAAATRTSLSSGESLAGSVSCGELGGCSRAAGGGCLGGAGPQRANIQAGGGAFGGVGTRHRTKSGTGPNRVGMGCRATLGG
jgi:hypothetical protein